MELGRELPVDPLVSVVVPAFNAESTIRSTLESVLAQTYRNLEIIVVDDGSIDSTAALVASIPPCDVPIRYEYKPNGGVASARNCGIRLANGELLATLDADDLWHPTKIERQVARLQAAGEGAAMVYVWCSWMDQDGSTLAFAPRKYVEGDILPYLCLGDIILSGSNALFRTDALRAVGGFDENLRASGAQGCEDWKLYMEMGSRYAVALVPDFLVRYRRSAASMSEDYLQMMRSYRMVELDFSRRFPQYRRQLGYGRVKLTRSFVLRALKRHEYAMMFRLLAGYPDPSSRFLLQSILTALSLVPRWINSRLRRSMSLSPASRSADMGKSTVRRPH